MKKILSFRNSIAASRSKEFNVFVLLAVFLFVCAQAGAAGITRTWVGTGVGAGANLANGSNWTPAGVPTASDTCVISYSGAAGGSFNLNLPTSSSLSISVLTIKLSPLVTATATTLITFNILNTLNISGALTITNTSASALNDEIDFNIGNTSGTTPGTVTSGSVAIAADGVGNSLTALPTLHFVINTGSTVTCNGNWSSTSAAGSYTSTLVQNNGTLTINGNTSLNNLGKSGKNTINFLVGNSPSITTFGGNAIFGSSVFKQWDSIRAVVPHDTINFKDTVLIGGISNASTGIFAFKGINDTLGYNMGITNFRKGTLLFNNATGTTQTIVSYASDDAPDRTPGTFQAGSTNSPIVNYLLGAGANDALTISSALIVNTNSTLGLSGVVTPYNLSKIDTNGLVQVKAGAKLILLTAAGKTSSVPGNYKIYNFDPTSTLMFNGKGYQTLYSGVDYGNVIISGNKDSVKTAGGTLTIKGTLTIDTGRIFQVRFDTALVKDTITIQGGITNYGTFKAMDGTVMLDSNTNVFISGTSVTTFNKLIIDKSGGLVTMNKDVIVNDTIAIDSGKLALNGNILTASGTMVGNSSATITGSTASGLVIGGRADSLYFTQSITNNYLKTFTVSGTATLRNALNIAGGDATTGYGTLTVNGILNTGNLLALKSDANGTAMVGPSTGMINDTVTVERYFPALRAWRFVAIPFSSSNQTINTAWQEGWVNTVLGCPSQHTGTPGYGTEISGGSAANGFDINNTGYASIKVYQNNAWIVPASTYSNLVTSSSNNAYGLFVRGDRSVCLTNTNPPDVTTLRPRGILNQRNHGHDTTINFSGAHPGDFILIGNPYAAPLDIEAAVALSGRNSGISSDKFLVWNPTLGGVSGVGGYVTFDGGVQVPYDLAKDTTNYAAGTVIQSGEAFMVQVSSSNSTGSGFVTFKESDKSSVETITGVFGLQASPKQSQSSFIQASPKQGNPYTPPALYVNMLDQNNAITDGIGVAFGKKYSPYIDSIDAQKKWNEEIENMAIVKHDTTLAIDFRPVAKASDTVFIRVYLRQHPYTLQIFTRGVREDLPAEGWLVDKYLGTQTQLDIYNVNLYTFTPNSDTNSYRNRFMIVFNRTGKKQQQENKGIKTSTNAVTGSNLVNGGNVSIYPNPVTGGTAMLNFNNMPAGNYELIVYNAVGERLSNISLEHNGSNTVYPLQISSSWNTGLFAINILNKSTGKMIVVKALVSK